MGTHYKGKPAEVRALNAYIKLLRAASSVGGRIERRLAEHGLTETQFGVLEVLLHLGPRCQSELRDKLLVSGGNVTVVVDNLEKRGLVRRERDTADRRFVTVHLTGEGRALVAGIFPAHVTRIVEAMGALTPAEQNELGRLCKKVGLASSS